MKQGFGSPDRKTRAILFVASAFRRKVSWELDRQAGSRRHYIHPDRRVSFHQQADTFPAKTLKTMIELQDGKLTPLRATPGDWGNMRFAPDGRRLALQILDGTQWDVWV